MGVELSVQGHIELPDLHLDSDLPQRYRAQPAFNRGVAKQRAALRRQALGLGDGEQKRRVYPEAVSLAEDLVNLLSRKWSVPTRFHHNKSASASEHWLRRLNPGEPNKRTPGFRDDDFFALKGTFDQA